MRRLLFVVVLLPLAGCYRPVPTATGPPPAVSEPVAARPQETIAGLVKHPFWKRQPTENELQAILDRANTSGGPSVLWIDDSGHCWGDGASPPAQASARSFAINARTVFRQTPTTCADVRKGMDAFLEHEAYRARFPER